mmetsp:Transcript_10344/g.15397  ORF Transcript_10344/g.15397 Transcript_10344/m.15397 type:complete len:102 (+) Transcript_10344:2319-2624(+)
MAKAKESTGELREETRFNKEDLEMVDALCGLMEGVTGDWKVVNKEDPGSVGNMESRMELLEKGCAQRTIDRTESRHKNTSRNKGKPVNFFRWSPNKGIGKA